MKEGLIQLKTLRSHAEGSIHKNYNAMKDIFEILGSVVLLGSMAFMLYLALWIFCPC